MFSLFAQSQGLSSRNVRWRGGGGQEDVGLKLSQVLESNAAAREGAHVEGLLTVWMDVAYCLSSVVE